MIGDQRTQGLLHLRNVRILEQDQAQHRFAAPDTGAVGGLLSRVGDRHHHLVVALSFDNVAVPFQGQDEEVIDLVAIHFPSRKQGHFAAHPVVEQDIAAADFRNQLGENLDVDVLVVHFDGPLSQLLGLWRAQQRSTCRRRLGLGLWWLPPSTQRKAQPEERSHEDEPPVHGWGTTVH